MSGVIEVSLPRYSVTPLDRTEDEYWTQCTKQSVLRGGTWTVFNWNQLVTGHAMQRIQYSSDLKVPQAEIHLEELFDFLLDRGAVPDAKGIHMLRVSGLWTPTGTCLMLCPDATQTALRVSMPDDSDGFLSLALQWRSDWNKRDPSSLPPGWMRLEFPSEAANEAVKCSSDSQKLINLENTPSQQVPNEDEKVGTSRSKDASTVPPAYSPAPTSVRFNLSSLPSYPHVQIRYPMYEYNTVPLGAAAVPLGHWLAPLLLTLSLSNPYPTTFLTLPPFLQVLSEHSSVPCGVLVMTKLLSVNDVPEWETVYPSNVLGVEAHDSFIVQQQAIARERILPEGQRKEAQKLRAQEELSAMSRQAMRKLRERTEREGRREIEAINSPKLDISLVMNAALGALAGDGLVINPESQDKEAAEGKDAGQLAVEHLLAGVWKASTGIDYLENEWALKTCDMLNRWRDWIDRGGMNKEDLRAIIKQRRAFCGAIVLVGFMTRVYNKEKTDGGGLQGDVRECLRVWKKVRIG